MLLSLTPGDNIETNTLPYFGGSTLPGTPQMDTIKNQFFEGLNFGCQCFFDISTDLGEKYFDVL